MDTPESKDGAESDAQADDPALGPRPKKPDAEQRTNEGKQDKEVRGDKQQGSGKRGIFRSIGYHVLALRDIGPDRTIELILTGVIAFFAYVQLKTTTANYSSTTSQTNQLITAANTSASAADKNAAAAQSFADSAQSINQGIGHAVGELNLQAEATKDLAAAAGRQADRALEQADATKTLAATAQQANDNARQALEVQTRPWLGIEGQFATLGATHRTVEGIYVTFKIGLHDYGQSPALDIVPSIPVETVGGKNSPAPTDAAAAVCKQANENSGIADSTKDTELVVWPSTTKEYEIRVLSKSLAGTWAEGCFSYKSASGTVYDTFFLYRIYIGINPIDHQTVDINGIELFSIQPLQ